MTDEVREAYLGVMSGNHTFSSPAPRFLDPAGVNEFGYVDPLQRLRQQQGLQALGRIGQQQQYVASTPLYEAPGNMGTLYQAPPVLRYARPRHRSAIEREFDAAVVAVVVILIVTAVTTVARKISAAIAARRARRAAR